MFVNQLFATLINLCFQLVTLGSNITRYGELYLKRKALPCSLKGTVGALRNLLRMMHRSVTKVGGGQEINVQNMT